jgi:hypothetical protein
VTNCANCHNPPNAEAHAGDPIYAPIRTWQSSMMGNSARDPVFWAAIAIASQDSPDVSNGETDLCIRCHAPRAFLEGRGTAISMDELQPDDRAGVECELCHRMQVDGIGSAGGIGNAQYTIDDVLVGGNVPRRGPWAWTDADPFPPPHSWINDSGIGTSALCGTCHDVTTPRPRVDDDGNQLGVLFNEQRTYSEWANSSFAQDPERLATCQDCHMPPVDDMAACVVNTNNGASHPTGGRRHALAGANMFMMDVLDHLYGDAGTGEVPSAAYAQTRDAIADVLATAATLELEPPDGVEMGAGLLDLGVRVTNNTGHKLPTGYSEGRVMWLELTARYGEQVVFASGQPDQIAGDAPDPLLRTYRGVAEQFATGIETHLLLNDHWIEDTRIPPLGMVQSVETDPVGDRYEVLPDGTWPNYDAFTYDFEGAPDVMDATPGDANDDTLSVQVRLLYMINTPEYIAFLEDTNVTNEAGVQVASVFDDLGGAPAMELAVASVNIPITSFGPIDDTSGGGSSSDEEGSGTSMGNETSATASGTATTQPTTSSASDTADATDTDTDTAGGVEGEGCGCRSSSSTPWLALLLLPLAARRRRSASRLQRSRV